MNINIENLTKIYGKGESEIKALNDVSFTLEGGEFVVILGPSGSGKSTLLNILGGMDCATSGKVVVADKEITALKDKQLASYRRNDIGFVFQFYNLMPNLTSLENVKLAENKGGMTAKTALIRVGLGERLNNFPSQLSGGEQQRVSIARAIVKKPKLLLCDEPTGALDSKTGKTIVKLLLELSKNKNNTTIVVTHNANLALVADRVIRLLDGKIISNEINANPTNVDDIEW